MNPPQYNNPDMHSAWWAGYTEGLKKSKEVLEESE